jgi:opacity protein-like surface antigen
MKLAAVASLAVFLGLVSAADAQIGDSTGFGSKNTYSSFLEYSNDSSHIVLGRSSNRKFLSFGFQYQRRLVSRKDFVWSYIAEFRPFILESDPTSILTETLTSSSSSMTSTSSPLAVEQCSPALRSFSIIDPTTGILYNGTLLTTCSRRWTYAQGLAPIGTRINLMSHRRLQPTVSFLAGYLLSTNKIPIDSAGSFNFTFEFGAGLEYYQSQSRSMRLEYQIQHFSNANTANDNPGVDNGLFKLTYNFGR